MTLLPWYIVTDPGTLADKYCYPSNFDLPWLSKNKVIGHVRSKGGPYKKVEKRMDEKTKKYNDRYGSTHAFYDPIHNWFKKVSDIAEGELYIFLPLGSIPAAYDAEKYTDFPRKFYEDPLDITKSTTAKYKSLLKECEMENDSYLVYFDELLQPFPIIPENWSDKNSIEENIAAVPPELREHYRQHVVEPTIFDVGKAIDRMKKTIFHKESHGYELKKKELALKENEAKFKRDLIIDSILCSAMSELQLKHFYEKQNLSKKSVYIVGSKQEIYHYIRAFENYEWINPIEGVSDSNQRVKIIRQGGIGSDHALRALKNRIEKTYQKKSKQSVLI